MESFENITRRIRDVLAANEEFAGSNIVTLGFVPRTLPNPLRSLYTVVKPVKMTVEENTEEGSSYSKVVRYTVGISLHKAERRDPSELLTRFTIALEVFEASNDFTVFDAGFDSMKRDPDTNSIVLPAYITLKMYY